MSFLILIFLDLKKILEALNRGKPFPFLPFPFLLAFHEELEGK